MKKLLVSFTVLALCLFVTVSTFAQGEQNPVIEIPKEAVTGATISLKDATEVESANAPQMTISAEEEATKREFNTKKNKSAKMSAAPSASGSVSASAVSTKKTFRIYAYMYCESKGGDDGYRLEPYGYTQVMPVNSAGIVIAPPTAPGSSLLFNRALNNFMYIKPGQTILLNSVSYVLDIHQNTRLLLRGNLSDDDKNSDDGYYPNANDPMGKYSEYLALSTIVNNNNYANVNHRYVNGNQIIWIKYHIYAY